MTFPFHCDKENLSPDKVRKHRDKSASGKGFWREARVAVRVAPGIVQVFAVYSQPAVGVLPREVRLLQSA